MNIKNRLQKLENQKNADSTCRENPSFVITFTIDGGEPPKNNCVNCGKPLRIIPGLQTVVIVPTATGGAVEL